MTARLLSPALLLALSLGAAGCLTESALMALSGPDDSATASSSETDGASDSSSGVSGHATVGSTTSTVTSATSGDPTFDSSGATDNGTTGDDTSTTGIDDLPPPSIEGRELTPASIDHNGPIHVTVLSANAEGVRMALDDGALVELTATADPDLFVGEIPALTAFDNGEHVAVLTPWRDDVLGEPVEEFYVLDLPPPGSLLHWEASNLIGSGRVAAIGHLATREMVELGAILDDQNVPRCYLRKRSEGGEWGPDDVIPLLPSSECEPIDLEVGDGDELFVLARWKTKNNDHRWWLGEIPTWGAPTQTIGMGTQGEEAYALAHLEGALAVCGADTTTEGDLDAIVRVYREGEDQDIRLFDYVPHMDQQHWFSESARDCLFVDPDNLVLVGEIYGELDLWDKKKRERRFILPYEIGSNTAPEFVVAGPGPGKATQSVARGLARDDDGLLYVVGRICEDECVAEGQLWIHHADLTPKSETSLGLFSNDILSPRAIRWSPAGYAVVASGGVAGQETDFTVRAYAADQLAPVWSFAGPGNIFLNVALTVAIGPYAEVCAAGFGANAYPAVACFGS